MRKVFGLAAAAFLAAGSAEAATFQTTSATAVNIPGGYKFTVGDLEMTVTAGLFADNATGNVAPGAQNARPNAFSIGLGASNDGDTDHTIDGRGDNEVLILSFNRNVIIESLLFSFFDAADDFDLFFDSDGNGVLNRVFNNIDIPNSGLALITGLLPAGNWFGVGADGSDDSFKLRAVTVSEVPIPAALPLFLAGLAGLGFAGVGRKPKSVV